MAIFCSRFQISGFFPLTGRVLWRIVDFVGSNGPVEPRNRRFKTTDFATALTAVHIYVPAASRPAKSRRFFINTRHRQHFLGLTIHSGLCRGTSRLRGPDTLWRVPCSRLLAFIFFRPLYHFHHQRGPGIDYCSWRGSDGEVSGSCKQSYLRAALGK